MIKRSSDIEPTLEHMKKGGEAERNPLKNAIWRVPHAVLAQSSTPDIYTREIRLAT